MPLSASEIDALEFSLSLRGYNTREVDDLLDRLAAQTHRTDRELGELKSQLRDTVLQLQAAERTIEDLRRQLERAHELAQAATDQAQHQADEMHQLARDESELQASMSAELEQQMQAVRAEADARTTEANRRIAEIDDEVDRRVAAINAEVEKRIQRLYDDADRRVSEAWAEAETERLALEQQRQQVDAELQTLRDIAALLGDADPPGAVSRLQSMHGTVTPPTSEQGTSGNQPAGADDRPVEPDVDELLDEPALPRASLQLVPGERDAEPAPEVHDVGGFRIKVFPASETS